MFDVDNFFQRISKLEEMIGWENFPQEIKIFADLMLFRYEVGNGGVEQYYYNSVGVSALLIPEYLAIIKANNLAKKLTEINSFFGKKGPSKDRKLRQKSLHHLSDKQLDLMNGFDNLVFDGLENIEELLIKYADKNNLEEVVQKME